MLYTACNRTNTLSNDVLITTCPATKPDASPKPSNGGLAGGGAVLPPEEAERKSDGSSDVTRASPRRIERENDDGGYVASGRPRRIRNVHGAATPPPLRSRHRSAAIQPNGAKAVEQQPQPPRRRDQAPRS